MAKAIVLSAPKIRRDSRSRPIWSVPNAWSPIIQVVVLNLAYMIVGVVVIEVVFVYPGLGALIVDAVLNRDLPVIQGTAMVFATAYVLLFLLADILSMLANPRLRHRR